MSHVTRGRVVALVALVVAIAAVELGWRTPQPTSVTLPVPAPLAGVVAELRSAPQRHVHDAEAGAIVAGVVYGRAQDVTAADQQAFLASGLWHLLAASGQNVALVTTCCVFLARGLGAGRTTGTVLAIAAIPAYVLVVGGGASIVRAGIMGVVVLVAWIAGRLADPWQVLAMAAAAICWASPGAYRGLGMQLSFACVAALVAGAVPVTDALRERGLPRELAAAVAATVLCGLATAPILQLRTGAAPLTGTVANLVAVPAAGVLLVIGLAGSIAAVLLAAVDAPPQLGDALLWPSGVLAQVLAAIARRAARLPLAQTSSVVVNVGVPVAVAVGIVVVRRGIVGVRTTSAVVVASLLALGVIGARGVAVPGVGHVRAGPVPAGVARFASLDIGQGDATLVTSGEHAILIDAGPPDGRVVDRVRELGVRRIDGLVLTHDSLDHRGGFDAVLAGLKPAWVARPHLAPGPWQHVEHDAPELVELCRGDRFDVGDVRLDVLHPTCDGHITPRTGDLHNDGALVLLASHGQVRALFPADAEAPVLVRLPLPLLDLLRVSHHGSDDPMLPTLLERTRPSVATISVGAGNDYGHPRRETLDALAAAGVEVHRTDRDGTVELRSDGRSLAIVE